jgi:hypothetical protein
MEQGMSEELKAKIAEQAREIAEWQRAAKLEASLADEARAEIKSLRATIDALKLDHNSGAVVLPERFNMEPYQTVDMGSANYKAGFNKALKLAARLNASRVPDGWQLVPVEPTKAMLKAAKLSGVIDPRVSGYCYQLMLSAAPVPAVEPAHSDVVSVPRELLRFLLGESELHGVAFGDARPPLGKFWWRTELRALLEGEV